MIIAAFSNQRWTGIYETDRGVPILARIAIGAELLKTVSANCRWK